MSGHGNLLHSNDQYRGFSALLSTVPSWPMRSVVKGRSRPVAAGRALEERTSAHLLDSKTAVVRHVFGRPVSGIARRRKDRCISARRCSGPRVSPEVAWLRNPNIPIAFLGYWAYTATNRQANEDLAPHSVRTDARAPRQGPAVEPQTDPVDKIQE